MKLREGDLQIWKGGIWVFPNPLIRIYELTTYGGEAP
jgi:hypothetical protein